MKKTSVLLLVIGVVMLAASPAMAEVRSGEVTVSPFVGSYTFDGLQHLDTSATAGLRVGYSLNRNWGIEGQIGYVPLESSVSAGTDNGNLYNARLDMLYHFMPEKKLVPFLALGGGWSRVQISGTNYNNDDATLDYGAGAEYFIADRLALRGDFRHLFSFHSSAGGASNYWQNFEYTIGLSFKFGGKQHAARTVAEPASDPLPVEKAASPPAPEQEPAPVRTASWQGEAKAAPAGKIMVYGMRVVENVLEFTATESIRNYKVLTLSNPSRLVIDVTNGVNGLGADRIQVTQLGITTVRFENTPEYLRIILDAAEVRLIPYRIEETDTGFKVIVTTP